MMLTLDRQNDFVQKPFITTFCLLSAYVIGIGLPEFQSPLPYRFIGHDDAA